MRDAVQDVRIAIGSAAASQEDHPSGGVSEGAAGRSASSDASDPNDAARSASRDNFADDNERASHNVEAAFRAAENATAATLSDVAGALPSGNRFERRGSFHAPQRPLRRSSFSFKQKQAAAAKSAEASDTCCFVTCLSSG